MEGCINERKSRVQFPWSIRRQMSSRLSRLVLIGREYSAAGWRDLLDQLQFKGLLREDPNDGRPVIRLGEADGVRSVYRGARRISMRQMTTIDVTVAAQKALSAVHRLGGRFGRGRIVRPPAG
jgi:hypothetical protein